MRFYLAKTLESMKMYGNIYDLTIESSDRVEVFSLDFDENEWFIETLVDKINSECNTLLDDGDYDFFDTIQCKNLYNVLLSLDTSNISIKYKKIIDVLIKFSQSAIELNTGVAIDL